MFECGYELESQGLLDAHMKNHQIHKPEFACEKCDVTFRKKVELDTCQDFIESCLYDNAGVYLFQCPLSLCLSTQDKVIIRQKKFI